MAGRGKKRATRSGPAEDQSERGDQLRQILMEVLTPFTARIEALEARLTPTPPPTPTPTVILAPPPPTVPVVMAPRPDGQEQWMRLIERYQKLRAPEFQGGFEPLVANKWKRDVCTLLELIGVEPVQRQRLASISLKGDARMWYDSHFSREEKLTATWEEFERSFDAYFISSAAKAAKEAELIGLEQGDLSVADYESRFVGLCNFTDLFSEPVRRARMFEKGLRPQIRQIVVSLGLPTQRAVADSAMAIERDIARAKEAAAKAGQAAEKGKGKRPFAAVQGAAAPVRAAPPAGGQEHRTEDPRTCYNCRQVGHISRDCQAPRRGGPGGGGGRGPAQGRGQQQQHQQRAPQPYQQQ